MHGFSYTSYRSPQWILIVSMHSLLSWVKRVATRRGTWRGYQSNLQVLPSIYSNSKGFESRRDIHCRKMIIRVSGALKRTVVVGNRSFYNLCEIHLQSHVSKCSQLPLWVLRSASWLVNDCQSYVQATDLV